MLIGEVKDYGNDILSLAKSSPLQGSMKSYYVIAVKDKDGNIITYRESGLRSLVAGFLWLVANALGLYNYNFSISGYPVLVNKSGNTTLVYPKSYYLITIGTGTQTFSPTINSLAAPISNGFANVSFTHSITSSGTLQVIFYGEYNNGNSSISVSEFGLLYTWNPSNPSSGNSYLLSYDTLSPPVTVPPGGSISIAIVVNLTG